MWKIFIKTRPNVWYKPEYHTTRTSDYMAGESKFRRFLGKWSSEIAWTFAESDDLAFSLKSSSLAPSTKKLIEDINKRFVPYGAAVDALQDAKKIRGVSLTDIFLETRNDDQIKRLVKAAELNPKSPEKMHSLLDCPTCSKFANNPLMTI